LRRLKRNATGGAAPPVAFSLSSLAPTDKPDGRLT
jgi:hypothetical protein